MYQLTLLSTYHWADSWCINHKRRPPCSTNTASCVQARTLFYWPSFCTCSILHVQSLSEDWKLLIHSFHNITVWRSLYFGTINNNVHCLFFAPDHRLGFLYSHVSNPFNAPILWSKLMICMKCSHMCQKNNKLPGNVVEPYIHASV